MNRVIDTFILIIFVSNYSFGQWQWLNPSPQSNTLRSICFTNDSTGYAVGFKGALIKTTDGGENWNITDVQDQNLSSVYFINENTGYIAGLNGTILKTSNAGIDWIDISVVEQYLFSSIYFINEQVGYIAGEGGTILKTDNGGIPVELTSFTAGVNGNSVKLKWSTATETNNVGFEVLSFTQKDNEWKAIGFVPGYGTTTEPKSYSFMNENLLPGKYSYRLKQIDSDGSYECSDVIEAEIVILTRFVLEQNYPNPFNPSTVIEFSLPENVGNVKLSIYNALGEKVAELVNSELTAGKYQYQWSAQNVATGMYVYELHTDKFVSVKKMMLLK